MMRTNALAYVVSIGAIAGLFSGCGSDNNNNKGGGGSGGTSSGGTSSGGTSSGGTSSGGTSSGGTAGVAGTTGSGGTAGMGGSANCMAAGAGGLAGATGFWPSDYDATGTATVADGHHNAGMDCMTCHAAGNTLGAPVWLFAGTAHESDGTTPVVHAQVGVSDGTHTFTAYTATNGNFWVPACAGTLTWNNAKAHIRDAAGEMMMNSKPTAACNSSSCHGSASLPLKAP